MKATLRTSSLPRRGSGGFTLLETLVALVVFSVGLLGIVALQARSIRMSVDSEDRNRAALMADEVISQMWTSAVGGGSSTCGGSTVCSLNLTAAELTGWSNRVTAGLPSGAGSVTGPDANGIVTVQISWRPPSRPTAEPDNVYTTKLVFSQ
jgi:type IV pilus assembly protein PilV